MKFDCEINGEKCQIEMPEEVAYAIWYGYQQWLDTQDVDDILEDMEHGEGILPSNLTLDELREQKDKLIKYYRAERGDRYDRWECFDDAIYRISIEKKRKAAQEGE